MRRLEAGGFEEGRGGLAVADVMAAVGRSCSEGLRAAVGQRNWHG